MICFVQDPKVEEFVLFPADSFSMVDVSNGAIVVARQISGCNLSYPEWNRVFVRSRVKNKRNVRSFVTHEEIGNGFEYKPSLNMEVVGHVTQLCRSLSVISFVRCMENYMVS